jgi:hypothetical protein
MGEVEWMAERDKIVCAFGCHYAGQFGHRSDVPLLNLTRQDLVKRLIGHIDASTGDRHSLRLILSAYIDHAGFAALIKM